MANNLDLPKNFNYDESNFNGNYFNIDLFNVPATNHNQDAEIADDPAVFVLPKGCKICPRCNKKFRLRLYVKRHLKICGVTKYAFVCNHPGCSFKTKIARYLTRHKIKHGEKNLKCDICGKMFRLHETLRKHKKTHTILKYNCEICIKGFNFKSGLFNHIKRCHPA